MFDSSSGEREACKSRAAEENGQIKKKLERYPCISAPDGGCRAGVGPMLTRQQPVTDFHDPRIGELESRCQPSPAGPECT